MKTIREIKTISKDSMTGIEYSYAYSHPRGVQLSDVYNKPSQFKKDAFEECERIEEQCGGIGLLRILKAGRTNFSVGFKAIDGLHVLTAKYHYIIK